MNVNPVGTGASYFRELCGLLLGCEVTDRKNKRLELEKGLDDAIAMILRSEPAASKSPASRKIILVGNGGSAAMVSHVQNDLVKMVGVRAMVFTEQPLLTAISNDHGYDCAYEKLTTYWANKGDLLWAISSSGRSTNILRACRAARERGASVLTFSGFKADNPLRKQGDLNFYIPHERYGFVEMGHHVLCHYLTDRASEARPDAMKFWKDHG